MDIDERLKTLLVDCRWVRDPELAALLLPGLSEHAPPLVALPTPDGDVVPGVPVLCIPALADGVALVFASAVEEGLAGSPLSSVDGLEPEALRDDPLVLALTDLIAQASTPGIRASVVPVLAVAWIGQQLAAGRSGQVPGLSGDAAKKAMLAAGALGGVDPVARGACLRGVGFALAGRLGAAANMAAMAGAPVQLGGLYRQMLPDPLVMAFPRGTLDAGQGLGAAAEMLGLKVSEAVLNDAEKVATAVFQAHRDRADAGKLEPADSAISHFFHSGTDPERAIWHPFAGPAMVGLAPLLAGKQLGTVGLSRDAAKAYGNQRSARALASVWRQFTMAMCKWDVLSRMVDLVVPIRIEGGRAHTPRGRLPVDARWSLLVPRPASQSSLAAVAAVRLSDVLDSVTVALGGRHWARWSVIQAFHVACRDAGGSVRQVLGDAALVAFPAPEHALAFAGKIRTALGPGAMLAVDADGLEVKVPASAALGIGLALGAVDGGTDGESSSLGGRASVEALMLAGNGRADSVAHDPLSSRAAGWGQDGLHNHGVVASDTFVRSVVDRARKRGVPLHVRGESGQCGGVSDDFESYAVRAWWQDGKDVVAALLLGGPHTAHAGASELRRMSADELVAWRSADRVHARAERGRSVAAVSGYSGEMDKPSQSFFGLDSPTPTPTPGDVFSGLGEYKHELEEHTSDPGPGLHDFSLEDVADPAPAFAPRREAPAPVHAAPLMMLEDEDDEEEDTGAFEMVGEHSDNQGVSFANPSLGGFVSAPQELEAFPSGNPFDAVGPSDHGPGSFGPTGAQDASPLMMLEDEDEDEDDSGLGFAIVDDDDASSSMPAGPGLAMLPDEDEGLAPPATNEWDDPFSASAGRQSVGFASDRDGGGQAGAPAAQSEYEGEMELVGVAGFSLVEDESDNPTEDPFHDPDEFTGFYDNRVGAVSAGPAPAAAPVGGGNDQMAAEVTRLLRGYVVVEDGDVFTFGLPDGPLLRDAQTHDTAGDVGAAYKAFLLAKISEGFVPRADRVVALVPGVRPTAIDPALLRASYGDFQ